MYGTGVAHQHFYVAASPKLLGALHEFGTFDKSSGCEYNFQPRPAVLEPFATREHKRDVKAAWQQHKEFRKTRICAVYLPAWLLGRSPRVGMSRRQVRVLTALVGELTRVRGKSDRPDKAEIVVGAQVPAASGHGIIQCPILEPQGRYVAFCGNKRRAGHGYRIVGRSWRGWLYRCGYSEEVVQGDPLGCTRRFVRDLSELATPFQLTVAAYHPRRREWRPLEDLIPMMASKAACGWLDGCSVRVYGPENYLQVWRRYFAQRLGFAEIPGADQPMTIGNPRSYTRSFERNRQVQSAADAMAFIREQGWTRKQLAGRLGCSAAWVSQQLSGKRPWSRAFERKINDLANGCTNAL
jgi:hypothetical protein